MTEHMISCPTPSGAGTELIHVVTVTAVQVAGPWSMTRTRTTATSIAHQTPDTGHFCTLVQSVSERL